MKRNIGFLSFSCLGMSALFSNPSLSDLKNKRIWVKEKIETNFEWNMKWLKIYKREDTIFKHVSFNQIAYCENLITNDPPTLSPIEDKTSEWTIVSSHFIPKKRTFFEKIKFTYSLIARGIYLSILFIPAGVFAIGYVLFPWSKTIQDICWSFIFQAVSYAGPTWIKLLQWMATREDLFPKSLCERCAVFQTKTKPHSMKHSEEMLSKLNENWREFLELKNIIGSGCIGQVYLGTLNIERAIHYYPELVVEPSFKNKTSIKVAIKISHPRVEHQIITDLHWMRILAKLINKLPSAHWLSLEDAVLQFAHAMKRQIHLIEEGRSTMILRHNFSHVSKANLLYKWFQSKGIILLPQVFSPLMTDQVLIMTYENGIPITEWMETASVKEKKKVARLFVGAYLQMLFRDSLVHGDLHPGNILIHPNKENVNDIVFLDCGLVASLTQKDRNNLRDLFMQVINKNGVKAGQLILERSPKEHCKDPEAFCNDVQELVNRVFGNGILQLHEVGKVLLDMLHLASHHQVQLDPSFATVVLSLVVVEGLARQLDAQIDLLKEAGKFLFSDITGL